MYSIKLVCPAAEAELVSAALWEAGTEGIRENEDGDNLVLIAGFEKQIPDLLADYQPEWYKEDDTDWTLETERSWPARHLGHRLFLAPHWNTETTPTGRVRIIHNPGQASGTGDHPCTQLALLAIEKFVTPQAVIADIGTGSGLLAIAALKLAAQRCIALDTDEAALQTARENFHLNQLPLTLVAGTTDCLSSAFTIVVANISATVLISMADELVRLLQSDGTLILTGFPESEVSAVQSIFGPGEVTALNEWRCLSLHPS